MVERLALKQYWRNKPGLNTFSVMLALIVSFMLSMQAFAVIDDAPTFDTPEQHKQYNDLISIVRCPTCQNQNIAESNAALARQLRQIIVNKIHAGDNNDAIIAYLIERYGDFITYDPPFKPITWLLWLGPLVVMLVALTYWLVWRRSTQQTQPYLSTAEREELYAIIDKYRHEQSSI